MKLFKVFPFLLATTFLSSFALAQSDQALEDKVLSGGDTSSDETPPPEESNEDLSGFSTVPDDSRAREVAPEKQFNEDKVSAIQEAVSGPKQIPHAHILVVQNRYVKKEGAFELTPFSLGIQPGDSFRKQVQWGASIGYHFTENLGLEILHFAYITNLQTSLSDSIRGKTSLETKREEPVFVLGSALLWTPLHAKAATDSDVYHFEGYFILGGGMTKLESSNAGMAMPGLGFRAYMTRKAIFKAEIRDYIDAGKRTEQRLNVLVGASVLLGGGS